MDKGHGLPGQRAEYGYPQQPPMSGPRRNPVGTAPEQRGAVQPAIIPPSMRQAGAIGPAAALPAALAAPGTPEQSTDTVKKEVSKISRAILELSLESYRCFTEMQNLLSSSKSDQSKGFAQDQLGLLSWLKGVTEFIRAVKKHMQEGRMSLLNYLGEEEAFQKMATLHKHKFEKKSQLIGELDFMIKSILELNTLKPADGSSKELVAKATSGNQTSMFSVTAEEATEELARMQQYVSKINPEFVKIDKEPIDISYAKGSQYLVGCFDGTIQLIDKAKPENNKTFDKHLKNRSTWIRSIIIDCDGKIWVGTSNGLTVYNKDYRIIMEQSPYDDKVKFFGHFRILWASKNGRYIYWWCDRGSLKVFDAKTLKQLFKCKDFLKHSDERPNHYTFLDGNAKKLFLVTNHQTNAGVYYVLDFVKRKVHGGDRILPKNDTSMLFAHVCVAYNSPSDCIVTTGVGSFIAGDPKRMESKEEISHVSVYKLNPKENTVSLVDCMLNSELKLMTIAAVVFHTPNHSRILSVLTKHIYIMDLINGKLSVLFRVRDINRGECVHQMARLGRNFLFVGNLGQIFRIEFRKEFYFPEGAAIPDDKEFDLTHPGLTDDGSQEQSLVIRTGGKRSAGSLMNPDVSSLAQGLEGPPDVAAMSKSMQTPQASRSQNFGPLSLRNEPANQNPTFSPGNQGFMGGSGQVIQSQGSYQDPSAGSSPNPTSKSPGLSLGAGVIGKGPRQQASKVTNTALKPSGSPHIHPILGPVPIPQPNHSRSPPFVHKETLQPPQTSAGYYVPAPQMSFHTMNQGSFTNQSTYEYLQSHPVGGRQGVESAPYPFPAEQSHFQRRGQHSPAAGPIVNQSGLHPIGQQTHGDGQLPTESKPKHGAALGKKP